jgi:hypothetical protein
LNSLWEKLSPRERYLAIAVAAVFVASAAFAFTFRGVTRLRDLSRTIQRLETQLVTCHERDARTVSVEQAYKQVAAQHSSVWTEAEIHNRLRDEIFRLQLEDPEALPEQTKKLVEIPSMRQGSLKDTGAGYREYQLTIKIPQTDIYSLLIFLCRLQQSAQALRIDSLEIARQPESPLVMANIVVTRTVVDRAPEEGDETMAPEQAAAVFSWDGGRAEDWKADNCALSLVSEIGEQWAPGGSCLKAESQASGASCYMTHEFEAGVTYDLALEAMATVPATLMVAHDPDGSAFEGSQEIPGDAKPYRYRITFTVDGESGSKVKLRAPFVRLNGHGVVYVDNVGVVRRGA